MIAMGPRIILALALLALSSCGSADCPDGTIKSKHREEVRDGKVTYTETVEASIFPLSISSRRRRAARARRRAEWERNHDTYILNIQDENGNMCPCHVNQETYARC